MGKGCVRLSLRCCALCPTTDSLYTTVCSGQVSVVTALMLTFDHNSSLLHLLRKGNSRSDKDLAPSPAVKANYTRRRSTGASLPVAAMQFKQEVILRVFGRRRVHLYGDVLFLGLDV